MSQPQNRIASGMSFAQLGLLSGRSYQKYILPHDSVSVCPPATAASARQFHGPAREGLGGEKAARGDASLPVPPAPHLPRQSNTPTQVRTGSAPGEGERKCEGVFPQKSGKSRSYFRGSHSRGPAPAADPYPAPAPCRTQGVRGAADTPPASHEFATGLPRVRHLPSTGLRPCLRPVRARRIRAVRSRNTWFSGIARETFRCGAGKFGRRRDRRGSRTAWRSP